MRSLFGDAVSHSMNERNTNYLKHHIDILSFRDLAPGTIATYSSYMTQYIDWVEANLGAEQLSDVTWEEIRSFLLFLKENRLLNPRTVNVYIAQLRDFYQYVLHRDWDRYAVLSEKAFDLLVDYIRILHPHATKEDWLFPGQKADSHIHQQSVYNT